MKTNAEILAEYEILLHDFNDVNDAVRSIDFDVQSLLLDLDDADIGIYSDHFENLIDYLPLIKNMYDLAESIQSLLTDIKQKHELILKLGVNYKNAGQQIGQLAQMGINSESMIGALYAYGREVDEVMLNLIGSYLDDKRITKLIDECCKLNPEVEALCIPWIEYHHGKETRPLFKAYESFDNTADCGLSL